MHWIEATINHTDKAFQVTGLWQVGDANYCGMNDAAVLFCRSANANVEEGQAVLPQTAESITILNTTECGGNNTLIRPKNNPNAMDDMVRPCFQRKTAKKF